MIAAGALIVIDTLTSPRSIPCKQRLHVIERVDRDALAPDLAQRLRGWSESWPISDGMSNAVESPVWP